MKKIIFLSVCIALTALACEKQEMNKQIQGNWKITGISGSIAGFQSIRNFDAVRFDRSDRYSVYFNHTVIQGGSYEIKRQSSKDIENSGIEFLLTLHESFNNDPVANFYTDHPFEIFFLEDGKLTLSQSGITDGFNYHFVRE